MIERILLATDFSTRSDRALRRATMVARQSGAALSLVHVVDSDQPRYLIEAQTNASRSILDDTVRTIGEFDGIAADARVVSGDVFSGILQVAEDIDADLIIVGPHRRQIRDVFVGTTAERTIVHSQRPVLMTAGVPSAPYDRALLALDIDDSSRSAALLVQEMGILDRAEIIAMHAFAAPARGMMQRAMHEQEAIDHYVMGEEHRADKEFRTFVAEIGLESIRRRLSPINGSVAQSILESARDEDAALIVVGTGQRRGFARFMIGSVAEDVLGDADRDILVVPRRESSVAAAL